MLNTERIVPITKTDYLTLIGTVLKIHGTTFTLAKSKDVAGAFEIAEAGTYLVDQPVKTLDFKAASGTVYFTAAFDFEGITVNGVAAELAVAPVTDGATLYTATLADGAVTVAAITPIA